MSVFERYTPPENEISRSSTETKQSSPPDKEIADEISIKRRTPQESEAELTAPYAVRGYREQFSTKLDENGNVVPAEWGEAGSRRPDAYDLETNTVVEVKNYSVEKSSGKNNLVRNVREQTDASIEHYGENVQTIEVIDLRGHDVTVGDIEKLTEKLEEKCPEIGLDYRW